MNSERATACITIPARLVLYLTIIYKMPVVALSPNCTAQLEQEALCRIRTRTTLALQFSTMRLKIMGFFSLTAEVHWTEARTRRPAAAVALLVLQVALRPPQLVPAHSASPPPPPPSPQSPCPASRPWNLLVSAAETRL